jgi:RimJ/RimL family protein N-acetyltransferase
MGKDAAVMEYFRGLLTSEESDAMADRIEAHFDQHGFGLWAVEIPGQVAFAGFIGLAIPPFEASFTPCVEIGWRLARRFWGCGYATEGARATLEFGFEQLRLTEIVSMAVPANTRSVRVMKRLGMIFSAEFDHPKLDPGHKLRRHVLYRMRRSEWQRA